MFGRAGSRTASTLSTAIGDSKDEYWDTTLLLRALHGTATALQRNRVRESPLLHSQRGSQGTHVLDASSSADLSSRSTGIDMESNTCKSHVLCQPAATGIPQPGIHVDRGKQLHLHCLADGSIESV